jgi:holdfast attachment protein HfaA
MPEARPMRVATLSLFAALLGNVAAGAAHAADYGAAGDYNNPYGMSSAQENAPIDPSLRDGNGNLSVVNGVFTSSNMGQASVQQMSSLGAFNTGSTLSTGGVGFGGNVAQAQAIGNQLNVVTVGSGNTVIVNSHQTNNGDQSATVNENGN